MNEALTTAVKATQAANANPVPPATGQWIRDVVAAAEEFNITPDNWIDIKRLPGTVTDLPSLVNHLRTIRTELENPTDETKKSGRMRLYKLFVVCIHAVSAWIQGNPDYAQSLQAVVESIKDHARRNVPQGISAKGTKLWTASFDAGNARTTSCLTTLIHFMVTNAQAAAAAGAGGPPAGPGAPAGAGGGGAGGAGAAGGGGAGGR